MADQQPAHAGDAEADFSLAPKNPLETTHMAERDDVSQDHAHRTAIAQLLAYQQAWGVNCVISDTPTDWLARGDVPPVQPSALAGLQPAETGRASANGGHHRSNAQATSSHEPTAGKQSAAATAQETATRGQKQPASSPHDQASPATVGTPTPIEAPDLVALRAALEAFEGCPLKATAKNLCFYRGAASCDLMVIGEGPGRDEDLSGQPFVGRAGQLLDRMLAAIGRAETDTHITNVVYWRPPGNRTPTPAEILACRPFLERQIALVDPTVILLAGGAAAKALLDTPTGIMKLRGKWRTETLGGRARNVMATLHPAYLLRTPAAKRMAWQDLRAVATALNET